MTRTKIEKIREKELLILIKETSKEHPEVSNRKIDVDRYCIDSHYRGKVNWKLRNVEKYKECDRAHHKRRRENHRDQVREYNRNRCRNNPELMKERRRRFAEKHPGYTRKSFERWTINNPKKAMFCAATRTMCRAVINRLGIRPTECPHCGKKDCLIDFHHPNHLLWRKGTFCCKSCHYFFNRDKVPEADKIIDLKKLLREGISH